MNTTKKIYYCTCADFQRCVPIIDGIFLFAYTHGIKYDVADWFYCPWCGRMLISDCGMENQDTDQIIET